MIPPHDEHADSADLPNDADDLVTLTTAATEFQANTIVALLRDAGITAFAFGSVHGSLPLSSRRIQVPVQVRRADLEQATKALEDRMSEAANLNWEDVDVGERTDSVPLRPPNRMPMVIRLGYGAAIAIVVVVILAIIVSTILTVL